MRTLLLTTAAAALAIALPASAQILGGTVGANVGAGVALPQTATITDQVGSTVRGAADMTRGTVRDVRSTADSAANASVGASVQSDTQVAADRNGADASLNISTGAMVHGSDGNMLGSVVRLTRDSAGRLESFVVRSADGTLRSVPATGASVQGDAVVTAWTSSEFNRAAPVQ